MRRTILLTFALFLAAVFLTANLAARADEAADGKPRLAEGNAASGGSRVLLALGGVLALVIMGGGALLAMRKKTSASDRLADATIPAPALPTKLALVPDMPRMPALAPDIERTDGFASPVADARAATPAKTTALSSVAAPPVAPPGPAGSIVCLSGALVGRRFEITAEGFFIGRNPRAAEVVIANAGVSGRHAWVGLRNGCAVVVDAGSTNGTFVNAVSNGRIQEVALQAGDTIIIGETGMAQFNYHQ